MKKPEIYTLVQRVNGRQLSPYKRGLARYQLVKLIQYTKELEKQLENLKK